MSDGGRLGASRRSRGGTEGGGSTVGQQQQQQRQKCHCALRASASHRQPQSPACCVRCVPRPSLAVTGAKFASPSVAASNRIAVAAVSGMRWREGSVRCDRLQCCTAASLLARRCPPLICGRCRLLLCCCCCCLPSCSCHRLSSPLLSQACIPSVCRCLVEHRRMLPYCARMMMRLRCG